MTGGGIAALPMYDWPEIRAHTDAAWRVLYRHLRARGLAAPLRLSRGGDPMDLWLAPELVLGQTCGLPYARHLAGRVRLLGTPVYALNDCPPGDYYSVIIAAPDAARRSVVDLAANGRFACNGPGSQSGFRALCEYLGPAGRFRERLAAGLVTGSHRNSVRAVAGGQADFAAIDAVSWRLAERYEAAAAGVRLVARTAPGPGLPLICSLSVDGGAVAEAVEAALAALEGPTVAALGLTGAFRRRVPDDYRCDDDALPSAPVTAAPA